MIKKIQFMATKNDIEIKINDYILPCEMLIDCQINRKILNEELYIDLSSADLIIRSHKAVLSILEDLETKKILRVYKNAKIEFVGVLEDYQDFLISDREDIRLRAVDILTLLNVNPKETVLEGFLYTDLNDLKPMPLSLLLENLFKYLSENIIEFPFKLGDIASVDKKFVSETFFLPYNETLYENLKRLCFEFRLFILFEDEAFNFYSLEEELKRKEFSLLECIEIDKTRVSILKKENTDLELTFTDRVYKSIAELIKENKAIFSAASPQGETINTPLSFIFINTWYPFRASTGVIWSSIGTGFLRSNIKVIENEVKVFTIQEREREINPIIAIFNAMPLWNPYNDCFKKYGSENLKKVISKSEVLKKYPNDSILRTIINARYPDDKNTICNVDEFRLNLDFFEARLNEIAVAWYVQPTKKTTSASYKILIYYDIFADTFYRRTEITYTEYKQKLEKINKLFLFYINDRDLARDFFNFYSSFLRIPSLIVNFAAFKDTSLGKKAQISLKLKSGERKYTSLVISKLWNILNDKIEYRGIQEFPIKKSSIIIKENNLEQVKVVGRLSIASEWDTYFQEILIQHNYNDRSVFDFLNGDGAGSLPLKDPVLLTNNIYNIAERLNPESGNFYKNIYWEGLDDEFIYIIYPDDYVDGKVKDPFMEWAKEKIKNIKFIKKFDDSYFNFIETTAEDDETDSTEYLVPRCILHKSINTEKNEFGSLYLTPLQSRFIENYLPRRKDDWDGQKKNI